MTGNNNNPNIDEGEAAWAHNRWPTVGLFTGWGLAALLWLLFHWSWWLGILVVFGAGCVGCLAGFFIASIVYRNS